MYMDDLKIYASTSAQLQRLLKNNVKIHQMDKHELYKYLGYNQTSKLNHIAIKRRIIVLQNETMLISQVKT